MSLEPFPRGAARQEAPGARLFTLLAVAYFTVATFPVVSPGAGTGLDGSWVAELNRLALAPPVFGRLAAYTYGPLGYLLFPLYLGSNLLQGAAVRFLFAIAFAALAWRRLRDAGDLFAPAILASSQVLAMALGLGFEYQLLLLAQLTTALALEVGSVTLIAIGGALAAVLLFMKATSGVGALAACGAVLLAWLLERRPRAAAALVACAVAGTLAATLIAARWLPSVAELLPWLRHTLAIAAPWSETLSIVGPAVDLALALPALLGFGVLTAFLAWRRLPGRAAALASLGPVLLAFKHAFVRQDLHVLMFFPVVVASLGLVGSDPALRSRRGRLAVTACLAATLVGAFAVGARTRDDGGRAIGGRQILDTVLGLAGARAAVAWTAQDDLARSHGPEALGADRVEWLPEVTAGRTIGIVPWEQSLCIAQKIDCVVNPTLQTYMAYTPELDRETATFYAGPRAPDFVVLHLGSFDRRFVTFDTPETWGALRRHYTLSPRARGTFRAGGDFALLLERRQVPLFTREREVGQSRVTADQWIQVPRVAGKLVVRVRLTPNALHPLLRAAFRVDPVYLSLRDPIGRVTTYRITPATAATGLSVQEASLGLWHLMTLFQDQPTLRPVEAIRIDGPGLDYYEDEIRLEWLDELEGPAAQSQGRPEHAVPR